MNKITAITAVGLVSLAGVAHAFEFSPEGKTFVATGPTSATLNGITLACTGTIHGKTTKTGIGKVTSGSFTGAAGCSATGLSGLPWTMKATGASTATVFGVTFTSPIGNCGPANLNVNLSGGVVSFTNQPIGSCTGSGTLTTTPTLSIVPG
jgi:hypothetical protein